MDNSDDEVDFETDSQDFQSQNILEAEHVYLLMNKEHRISRNVRAYWFFSNLNGTVEITHQDNGGTELDILSIIPRDPPACWGPESSYAFKYKVVSSTTVTLLARSYRLVFCLDLSPSIMVVDSYSGEVMLDKMIISLRKCLEGLTAPFLVPGSSVVFTPQLYVTIIAHSSSFSLPNQQVLVQGWLLTADNLENFLGIIQSQLNDIEDYAAENVITNSNGNGASRALGSRQLSHERSMSVSYDDDAELTPENIHKRLGLSSPDVSFINLIRYGILALQLLPENTSAGIVVVTDGIINLPDIHLFQSLLTQLRNSTISCSFLHIGSSHQPSCCWSYPSFPDLLHFIATATYGAFIPVIYDENLQTENTLAPLCMNIYHQGLLVWSFHWGPYALKANIQKWPALAVKGDAAYSALRYSPSFETPMERNQHLEKNFASSMYTLISCRLREGYVIQDVIFKGHERVEVSLLLPWKQDVNIIYSVSSSWPPDPSSCRHRVIIEGSYEFLHDLTCPAKKPLKSQYRCNVVKKFMETLQNLSQTDALLAHLHSFASNPAFYTIPDSIRSGVPLFYFAYGSSRPVLCSSDLLPQRFSDFWEPICMLDMNIWQKWMHTHRIGFILSHDQPLPKYVHLPNSNDRYNIIQCRQALAALNTLLTEWSSFVLIENHSYIKFIFEEQDKPPVSFYVIRVTSKAPCMVIHLAFLGGISSPDRNEVVKQLKDKIFSLTSPSRPGMKELNSRKNHHERNFTASSGLDDGVPSKLSVSIKCCIELKKPIEKILIRYERTPKDYTSSIERLTPFQNRSSLAAAQRKSANMFSTLGRYLHHRRWVWSAQTNLSSAVSPQALARILSTLVKIRLQKGFHFAHSYSGVVNMVLELDMKDESEARQKGPSNYRMIDSVDGDVTYPCVIQYILFPPHSTTNLCESFSEDDVTAEGETTSTEENGELQLITECWIEPQQGFVFNTDKKTRHLEGMTYKQLPNAIADVDLECISAMLTFEHLSLMCQNKDVPIPDMSSTQILHKDISPNLSVNHESIQYVPFAFSLMRLLPKCRQAELLFSTLAQDFSSSLDEDEATSMSNRLLLQLFQKRILSFHDREVQLSQFEHQQFVLLLQERKSQIGPRRFSEDGILKSSEKSPLNCLDSAAGPSSSSGANESCSVAHWKCYIKRMTNSTHFVITFVPASFEDLKLLNRQEHWWNDANTESSYANGEVKKNRFCSVGLLHLPSVNGCKYVLPVYVYDCCLNGLTDQLIERVDSIHLDDILQDYRPSYDAREETSTIQSSNQSSDSSKHASPEPRAEESEASSSSEFRWKHHLNRLSMIFSHCFVSSVYQSLQKHFPVCCHDIQHIMEAICIETPFEIDITEFLQTVCSHVKNWPFKITSEPHVNVSNTETDSMASLVVSSSLKNYGCETFPSSFWSSFSCGTLQRVHDLIRIKFSSITKREFIQIPSNPDYYYYTSEHIQRNRLNTADTCEAVEDENEDGQDMVEFRLEVEGNQNDMEHGAKEPVQTSVASQVNSSVHSSFSDESRSFASEGQDEDFPPLFTHLTCTVNCGSEVSNCSIHTLPTCYRNILTNMNFTDSQLEKIDLYKLHVTLDIICLTLPPEVIAVVESDDSALRTGVRTTSFCSSNSVPHDFAVDIDDADGSHQLEDFMNDTATETPRHLPNCQSQAIERYVEEIKWMLKDEKASFARDVHPITEEVLRTVANHINDSSGRPGCSASKVPLQFVFGPDQSLEKFVQEFRRLSLPEYRLVHEGEYYYLALKHGGAIEHATALQSGLMSSSHSVSHSSPHPVDASELRKLLDAETLRSATLIRQKKTSNNFEEMESNEFGDEEDDGSEINKQPESGKENSLKKPVRCSKERRRHSERTYGKNGFSRKPSSDSSFSKTSEQMIMQSVVHSDNCSKDTGQHSHESIDRRERSSSTEDEIKQSISVCDAGGVATVRPHLFRKRKKSTGIATPNIGHTGNSTEDGYDGDSSDVDNDFDHSSDLEFKKPELPNFWLILHISRDDVDVFLQFRDAELDEPQLQHWKEVNRQVILHIKSVVKIVNQYLLLQDLHDTRTCNQLLEPEVNTDLWPSNQEEVAAVVASRRGTFVRWHSFDDQEQFIQCHDSYLEATMKFMPGAFSCPVVWEMSFYLHPRLKTGQGHGRNISKVGITSMKTVLTPLAVNRTNMFVYKEHNSGAVFYLRLHDSPHTGLRHHSEHSLSTARPSITDDGISLVGSRSSSLQSLAVGRMHLEGNEEFPEPRSRVNSLPEKDRDQSHDTVSMSSSVSNSRQKSLDDVLTLTVHGITEAGPEIKEDLVKALQNRLDDATLDMISVAFVRNPKCKLTSEDVHFIQRPGEPPKSVLQFCIQAQMLPFLQAVMYYLKQNLMQFLNIPMYIDGRSENHFQHFQIGTAEQFLHPQDSSTAFLYIRPQEASNRGIACIILSVVDGQGNHVQHVSCPRPQPNAYKDGLSSHEFDALTHTYLHEAMPNSTSKRPGPVALIQFQIWEKGKVDMEHLGEKLRMGIRYGLWDVITEYRILTAPIAEMPLVEEPPIICSEPCTPLKGKKPTPLPLEGVRPKERAASPLFLVQPISPPPPLPTSVPTSAHHHSHHHHHSPAAGKDDEIHLAMDAEVLRRQEKYELGDKGVLHPVYSVMVEQWFNFGRSIGVPTVQKHSLTLTSRYSLELFLRDLQTVISNLVSDTTPRVFKGKGGEFLPFHSLMPRDKKRVSGSLSLDGPRSNPTPPGKVNNFIMIARSVKQWRISSGQLEKEGITELAECKDSDAKVFSESQRFLPYICIGDRSSSDNASQLAPGKIVDATSDSHIVFIPRQRLLLIFICDCQISLYTYNWSTDKLNKFTERSSKLVEWYNLRSCFLSSIVHQKLGLFLNQPCMRKLNNSKQQGQEQKLGTYQSYKGPAFDLEMLKATGGIMLRREATGVLITAPQRRVSSSHACGIFPFVDILRDNKPHRPMYSTSFGTFRSDPVVEHVSQVCDLKSVDTRERQKKLLLLWQDREARAGIPIQLLKQISRIEHYCLTPILFHPLWRIHVAAARDHTLISYPPNVDHFPLYTTFQQQSAIDTSISSGMRSRHSSGTSAKGLETRHLRKSSVPSLISIPSFQPHLDRMTYPEEWHSTVCNAYIGEFVQYLQTLGFVSAHMHQTRPQQKLVRNPRGKSEVSGEDQPASNVCPQYMQKFLLGGILLLELVIHEPYFGVKIYSFESMRLRALSHRALNAQFVVAFLDECDKMKVSMHLHSFTYDYHLRNIHSYISGRQLYLRPGYHAVGFLDDFIKYYQKSPNFARNLVHQSHITISPTITTGQQLFEYLLKYDRLYDMRALKMTNLEEGEDPEYVLVQMSTRKVSYRDGSDIRQTDEFDVSLLVARDTQSFNSHLEFMDRHSLSLKYFIILTSCREMFPKPVVEKPQGTFRAVTTTALPPSRPPSRPSSRRVSLDRSEADLSVSIDRSSSRKLSSDGCSGPLTIEKSCDSRGEMSSLELTDSTLTSTTSTCDGDCKKPDCSTRLSGIRQEIVNYMGYFSTHEELMNNIMMEQVQEVKCHIQKVIKRAMVDCRRDFLWERLQKGSRETEDTIRRKKDDLRDLLYGLNYVEFTDLLKLVERTTLTDIDSRLAGLASMPINWYQTLVKVLLIKYQDCHRHFTAPDGNTQHVVILDTHFSSTFMLLSIDLHSSRAELCAVFREPHISHSSIFSLVEDVVNVCCYHLWSALL